ncbi:MAG: hypothetical protein LBJ89_02510, partial [Holosporales bacterium]|nr:hypothetical protein [Holosporales bacterium]
DPEQTDPEQTDPEQTDPEQTDPEQTDPEQTEPEQTDPEQTDPEQTDPEQTDPEQTDPEEEVHEDVPAVQTLFGSLSNPESFAAIVDEVKTSLDGMIAKLAVAANVGFTEQQFIEILGNFEWVNYHHLFAALMNNEAVDVESFRRELYSTPLIFMMSGIPYMERVSSLKNSMTEVANLGVATDTWMALQGPTLYSSFNFMQKVITGSSELFSEIPELVSTITYGVKELPDSGISNLYSNLTEPLYAQIHAFADYTGDFGGSLVSKFAGRTSVMNLVQEIVRLISLSQVNHYPINFQHIYFLLKQVEAVPNEELETSLGYSLNDHPRDTTIYGKLNGVLFELGAQLLLNFIGDQNDPSNVQYSTYYSRLNEAERAATIAAADDPDALTRIKANVDFVRRNLLSTLTGAISYYYKKCIPEATSSKFATLATELAKEYNAGDLTIDGLDRTDGTLVPHVASMIQLLTGSDPKLPSIPESVPDV